MPDIDIYSVSYKKIDYPLPSNWIKTIAVNNLKLDNMFHYNDNVLDNISHLNRYYGELTAQYWVHKNLLSSNHIGFCHYRRYFNFVLNDYRGHPKIRLNPDTSTISFLDSFNQQDVAKKILQIYDVILTPQYLLKDNIELQWKKNHPIEIWDIFLRSIAINAPSWLTKKIEFFQLSHQFHFYLMYIFPRDIFSEYMDILFRVIDPVFQIIGDIPDIEGSRFQPSRYPAYLAERFLMLYVFAKGLKVYDAQIVALEDNC